MNARLNRIRAGLMEGAEAKFLNQAGTRVLTHELEARLRASEYDFSYEVQDPGFKPDAEKSSFDPIKNDQFDTFHLRKRNCSKAADWTSDEAS